MNTAVDENAPTAERELAKCVFMDPGFAPDGAPRDDNLK
jgi:hypothetical protein